MSEWVASIMTSGVDWRTNLDLDGRQSGRAFDWPQWFRLTLPPVRPSVRAVTLQVAVPLHPSPDVERGPTNAKTCIPGKRCHRSGIGFGARGVRAHIAPDFTPK